MGIAEFVVEDNALDPPAIALLDDKLVNKLSP